MLFAVDLCENDIFLKVGTSLDLGVRFSFITLSASIHDSKDLGNITELSVN